MPQSTSVNSQGAKQGASQKGFTLIELLVVIAIVGLLSVIAMVGMTVARSKSRDTKRVADIRQIQKGLELFYTDNLGYPTVSSAAVLGQGTALSLCGTALSATCSGTAYISRLPTAPDVAESGCSASTYSYVSSATAGTSSSYSIVFCLGNKVGELNAGLRTATPSGIQ